MRFKLGSVLLLLTCMSVMAQTTIQYDSGNTGNAGVFPSGCCYGNYFTGLAASMTISKVTFYVTNNPGANNLHIKETLMATDAVLTMYNGTGDGFKTKTLASPFMFSGTQVHVGFNAYYGQGVPLDTVSNALGFHAYRAQTSPVAVTFGGNPANYVLRITGPTGLPVELQTFSIE